MKTILSLLAFTTLTLQAADKPNVVLFLVDDMGWMDCGVYGSKYYETPHMDKLAKQSMLFTDAYAHPLCSPTRASILSGQYPSRHAPQATILTNASADQLKIRACVFSFGLTGRGSDHKTCNIVLRKNAI